MIKIYFLLIILLINMANHELTIFLTSEKQNKLISLEINYNLAYVKIEKEPILNEDKIVVKTAQIFFFWKDFEFIYSISQKSLNLMKI